jgi:DNA-binding beta-propeller fold protein YncE
MLPIPATSRETAPIAPLVSDRMPSDAMRLAFLSLAAALVVPLRAPSAQPNAKPDATPNAPPGVVIASNMQDHTATLLDARTGATLATLPTGRGPHEVAVSHDGRWALVSNYGPRGEPGSTITVVDVGARTVARTIDLGDVRRPHGMRFLPGDTAFLVTSETSGAVVLVDFRDGRVRRALPSGGRATHMLGVSADGRRAVTANIADATISVLDLRDGGAPPAPRTIAVARQPEGIALAPDGATAWVGSNQDGVVLVVDVDRGAVVDTVRGFGVPYRIALSADGRTAVVTDPARGEVRVFDAATRSPRFTVTFPRDSLVATAEVPGSPSPEGVALSPDGRWAFVTLQGRDRVAAVDLTSGRVAWYGATGAWSDGVGYAPAPAR